MNNNKNGEDIHDSKIAQMTDEYVSSSNTPSPREKAAMMNENSPRHVMAIPEINASLSHGLKGKFSGTFCWR